MSVPKGIFRSFSDAPGGMKEELQEIMWSVGSELSIEDICFLRGGYCYENEHKGYHRYLTLGGGLKLYSFQLDASCIIGSKTSVNPIARFSVCYNF